MAHETVNLKMQHQLQDQWCWAAVSTSIADFFDASSNWTQCKMVNTGLEETGCCTDGSSCNRPWYLNKALEITGNLSKLAKGSQIFDHIAKEINQGRPLGCLIKWDNGNGSGHFVVITGVDTEDKSLDIRDPWNGPTNDLPYEVFAERYRGDGKWTYSFYTQK